MRLPFRPPASAASKSRPRRSIASWIATVAAVSRFLGEKQPGERDVLELPQVGEIVVRRQVALAGPALRFAKAPMCDPQAHLPRGDRSDVGEVVARVEAVGLVEQLERGVKIALGLADPGHRGVPAIRVLGQAEVVTQVRAALKVQTSGIEVVLLDAEVAQADVHVGRAAKRWCATFRCELQASLVGAHRLAQAALG